MSDAGSRMIWLRPTMTAHRTAPRRYGLDDMSIQTQK